MQKSARDAAAPATGGDVLAALDLGSNSFHLKLARHEAGRLVVVDRLREMVRLAAGLDSAGNLDEASQARALDCLARFGQRIREMRASTVRVVATNTFRKARKARAFRRQAEEILGHPIEIISGREEARLVYSGVAHSSPMRHDKLLVVDIGGGSTELIVGEGFVPRELFSLQMGCVSLTRRFFSDQQLSEENFRRARIAAEVELEPIIETLQAFSWDDAAGASGTVRAAAAVIMATGNAENALTLAGLQRLIATLKTCGSSNDLVLPGLDSKRAAVFAGGVVILETLFRVLGIETMRVADGALREGILFDLVGRFSEEDARARSVRALQERYNVDTAQAQRVEETALHLLRHLAAPWRLELPEQALLLRWAARTHEAGLAIAHAGYHRHGAYLLEHSDLAGFATREQGQLAAIVALHRKQFRVEELDRAGHRLRTVVSRLAIILRLAVVLRRGRSTQQVAMPRVVTSEQILRLSFKPGWRDAHPLTFADLQQEANYLRDAGLQLEIDESGGY